MIKIAVNVATVPFVCTFNGMPVKNGSFENGLCQRARLLRKKINCEPITLVKSRQRMWNGVSIYEHVNRLLSMLHKTYIAFVITIKGNNG